MTEKGAWERMREYVSAYEMAKENMRCHVWDVCCAALEKAYPDAGDEGGGNVLGFEEVVVWNISPDHCDCLRIDAVRIDCGTAWFMDSEYPEDAVTMDDFTVESLIDIVDSVAKML